MKEIISGFTIGICFILLTAASSIAQGNLIDFSSAGLSITLPGNWVASEHILLLMMPKEADLTIEAEVLSSNDLSEAVELTATELKSIYPQDTSYTLNDIVVNKMPVKKIYKVSGDDEFVAYFFKTPQEKIVRFKCSSEKSTVSKHRADIIKLIQSIKPKN